MTTERASVVAVTPALITGCVYGPAFSVSPEVKGGGRDRRIDAGMTGTNEMHDGLETLHSTSYTYIVKQNCKKNEYVLESQGRQVYQ